MPTFPTRATLNKSLAAQGYRLADRRELRTGESALLGQGEQGRVYRVVKESINRQFAAKIVVPRAARFSPAEIESFETEVRCMAALGDEENIVPVFDRFRFGNSVLCYVMMFVDAKNLKQRLAGGEFENADGPDHLVYIFGGISKGLLVMHDKAVAHRDLKEANIMVPDVRTGGYKAVITDFGFGYTYDGGRRKDAPPIRASSYAREAAFKGITGAGLDLYCFHKMIESALQQSAKLRKARVADSLKRLSDRLTVVAQSCTGVITDAVPYDEEVNEELREMRRLATTRWIDPEYAQLLVVPELTDVGDGDVIRLSGGTTVPLTQRVKLLLDSPPFQRLKTISQLASVDFVYPGASHTRFEHSIGVFNTARIVIRRLLQAAGPSLKGITRDDVERLLLAALLHDIGHVPHAHSLEEIGLYDHETRAKQIIQSAPISELIRQQWKPKPADVVDLITSAYHGAPIKQLLRSILSQAIDIDAMDYLRRDSIHLGVPYGNSFDMDRLISSLTINRKGVGLAVTHKGVVPAETFLIARYAMFSQVYFHHTVRAVTAMLQRAIWEKTQIMGKKAVLQGIMNKGCCDRALFQFIAGDDHKRPEYAILGPLARSERWIYKRLWELNGDVCDGLKRLSYSDRVGVSNRLVDGLKNKGLKVENWEVLIDVPKEKFQDVDMEVYFADTNRFGKLDSESPLISVLGKGFERNTGTIRVFLSPRHKVTEVAESIAYAKMEDMIREILGHLVRGSTE